MRIWLLIIISFVMIVYIAMMPEECKYSLKIGGMLVAGCNK